MKLKPLHTCIRVGNLEKSIEFYEKLGLKESRRKDFPGDFTLVYLKSDDDYELELTYNYGVESYNIGNGYGHIALGVDDLKKAHEEHTRLGLNPEELSGLNGSKSSFYFLTDPDGYDIEIIQL